MIVVVVVLFFTGESTW